MGTCDRVSLNVWMIADLRALHTTLLGVAAAGALLRPAWLQVAIPTGAAVNTVPGWASTRAPRPPGTCTPVVLVLVLRVQQRVQARPRVNLLLPRALLPALGVALQHVDLVDEGPARL